MLHSKTCVGGMVTAPHHLAAQAGAQVLKNGGNAVETMVERDFVTSAENHLKEKSKGKND